MLHAETPLELRTKVIDQAAVKQVTTFTELEKLKTIVWTLNEKDHNGFPIVSVSNKQLVSRQVSLSLLQYHCT